MFYEAVIHTTKEIEGVFRYAGYGGKGLHQLISNAEKDLDPHLVRSCRKIATTRNRLAHEDGVSLDRREFIEFLKDADECLTTLKILAGMPRSINSTASQERTMLGAGKLKETGVGSSAEEVTYIKREPSMASADGSAEADGGAIDAGRPSIFGRLKGFLADNARERSLTDKDYDNIADGLDKLAQLIMFRFM